MNAITIQFDKITKQRYESHLKKSKQFLWGLVKGSNKEETYALLGKEIKKRFRGTTFIPRINIKDSYSYEEATTELIKHLGIELIIGGIVVPIIIERFVEKPHEGALTYLRRFWEFNKHPDICFEIGFEISKKFFNPFLVLTSLGKSDAKEFDPKKRYVENWSDFATVWFMDIEQLDEVKMELKL